MADVLSQSQIDALLKSMQDGPPKEEKEEPKVVEVSVQESPKKEEAPAKEDNFSKYDFYSPRKFTKEKIRLLKSIFDNYARILTSQVNGIFRTMTDITVLELRETRYYEYVNAFHENDCMTIVETHVDGKGTSNVPLMSYISPGLTLTLVSHMLGVVLNVDISGLAMERIRICLPGTLLEHMFKIIDNRKHLARGFAYENNQDVIMEHLRASEFSLTGQLGIVKLDIEDLYHLKVGDVIDLNKEKDSSVKLYVGRQPWFTGKMGVFKKNIAVRIEERIMQKEELPKDDTEGFTQSPDEPEEDEELISNPGIDAEDLQELLDTDPSLDE